MKPRIKKMWIQALTDGSYKQICGAMRKEDNKNEICDTTASGLVPDMSPKNNNMCVMGVLADLAMRNARVRPTLTNWFKFADGNENPSDRTLEWAGLHDAEAQDMIDMNDGRKVSFKEFAEYIRGNL